MYPHIPHEEGLQAIRRALHKREQQNIRTDDIVDLPEIVLKNKSFVFGTEHYLQKMDSAIGTRMAPSYANIFMADPEQSLICTTSKKPYFWMRYMTTYL